MGGPGLHPTAGASAVGARRVLVEYNVTLETGDLGAARGMARAVRAESSGLTGVRAFALLVNGRAQVALAIRDYRQSSLSAVHGAITEAARKTRTSIHETTLVGLLPEAAYESESEWAAGLRDFHAEDRILERRLMHPLGWPESL